MKIPPVIVLVSCLFIAHAETPPGLRFHASFDGTRSATTAAGETLPTRFRHASQLATAESGTYVDGVFGQAITGKSTFGWYDAANLIDPARGTLAFHLKKSDQPYGFEPLVIRTVDQYYWYRYLRLKVHSNGGCLLTTWFPDEHYKPIVLYPPPEKANALTDDQWHHIAIVWDQAYGVKYFLDGELISSNWGQCSWTSRGVTPDFIQLVNSDNVAYDELYILDVPLEDKAIHNLATENRLPTQLPAPAWEAAHQENRRRELGWPDSGSTGITPDADGSLSLVQVVPTTARAVKKECHAVFDGRLGSGWPPIYNYDYAHGNGLHVQLPAAYDYVLIEGGFQGDVYGEHSLLPPPNQAPILETRFTSFTHWWTLPERRGAGWLSFFKAVMEQANDEVPDKEQLISSRIIDLSFFRREQPDFGHFASKIYHFSKTADIDLPGTFSFGDRTTLLAGSTAQSVELAPLRYTHLGVPASDSPLVATGLRLQLTTSVPPELLRIEVRDPRQPARRITAIDIAMDTPRLDLHLDFPDRLLEPGQYLLVSLVPLRGTTLEASSALDLYSTPSITPDYLKTELGYTKSWFRELSESRPWVYIEKPEDVLPTINSQAAELFEILTVLHRVAPDDAKVKALWAWTHKSLVNQEPVNPQQVPGCENAPEWALLQRELLRACAGVHHWWMANRQTPNGEFGDDWGDDTDLIQDFVKPAFFHDPGERFGNSVRLIANGVYGAGRIERGINVRTTDYLHAYEEGVNAQPVAALLTWGHPLYLERMMETAHTVQDWLTAYDAKGRRRFRASNYGAQEVHDQGGVDIPSNVLMLHAAMLLGYYSHHPAATKLLEEWADGWLSYMDEAKAAGRQQIPVTTTMDGQVTRWDRKLGGFGVADGFLAAYRLSNEPRFRIPGILQGSPQPDLGALGAMDMIDRKDRHSALIAWANLANLTLPYVDRFGFTARERALETELTDDPEPAMDAMRACLRNLRTLYPAYTWGEPINDRIWVPDQPAVIMALGDIPHERNQLWPRHHVSWSGFSDHAAWVRGKSDTHLKIEIYSFASTAEQGQLQVWRLRPGTYTVQQDGMSRTIYLHRGAAIPLELQPHRLTTLQIDLQQPDPNYWQRPDVAIGDGDAWWNYSGTLAVVVHNLGNSPATDITVSLLDAANKVVASQTIAVIEAPLDLRPRTVTVIFQRVEADTGLRIAIDTANAIAELNEDNNSLLVNHPYRN